MRNRNVFTLIALCAVVCFPAPSAVADPAIVNGDFSAGLTDWTVEWGDVTDGGGFALFQEDVPEFPGDLPDISSTLSQAFTLPGQALFLSFDLAMTAEGNPDPLAWPDAFTASLLDGGTLDPLVSWDPFVTEFFLFENTGLMETAVGVAVAGDTVSLDVSAWAGQDVLLSFDLWAGEDGMTTTAALDNVNVSLVPVPGAAVLGALGLASGLVGLRRKHKKAVS